MNFELIACVILLLTHNGLICQQRNMYPTVSPDIAFLSPQYNTPCEIVYSTRLRITRLSVLRHAMHACVAVPTKEGCKVRKYKHKYKQTTVSFPDNGFLLIFDLCLNLMYRVCQKSLNGFVRPNLRNPWDYRNSIRAKRCVLSLSFVWKCKNIDYLKFPMSYVQYTKKKCFCLFLSA
jgi:hypothetical protein